jgi:RES domain-containing protein
VLVWRLAKRSRPAFDGEGARLYGGRWNHPGVPIVYTAESLSLAVLEFFVHLDPEDAPDLVAISADVPDGVRVDRLDLRVLPRDWRATPAPASLADLGTAWARGGATALLAVLSALVPRETNYLLNPTHPDFRHVRIGRPEAFTLDPRLRRP